MSGGKQKIVLSALRDIPINKLVLSQANARRVKVGVSVEELAEELAEDIARRTLLQTLLQVVLFAVDAARPFDMREEKVFRVRLIVDLVGPDVNDVVVFDESRAIQTAAGKQFERGDSVVCLLLDGHPLTRVADRVPA